MGKTIGIDLGTTYSAVAVVNDLGQPEILVNREGERITPSVVLLQGDLVMVGSQAKRTAVSCPDDVVQFVKRQVGNPDWRFVTASGDEYTAEQVSAMILKRLKADAELALGETVTDAVITVPAYFDDARRTATRNAGQIAGLNVRHVLNEPTAAALTFGLESGFRGTVLVYDLGGGTFDATVLRIGDDLFDVLATDGDRNLGGFDWDNVIMSLVDTAVQTEGGPSLLDGGALEADLRDKAELAKKTLSNLERAQVFVSAGGRSHNITVTRAEFERASSHLLNTTEAIAEGTLEEAGHDWESVDSILVVGGSTRMPMVADMIRRLSGRPPSTDANPDEAVALGAAIRGHLLDAEHRGESSDALPTLVGGSSPRISDVTSQSLGVVAMNAETGRLENTVIIPRNQKVPTHPPRRERFTTTVDGQTSIELQVTEGDDVDLAYVSIIHKEPIAITPYPAGSPVEVVMSYDLDGTIHVEVIDLQAGRSLGEVELDRPSNIGQDALHEFTNQMEKREVH